MTSSGSTSNEKCWIVNTRRCPSFSMTAGEELQLLHNPRPIYWDNEGLHGVIPVELVKNALILRNEKRGAGLSPTPLMFHWHEAVVFTSYEAMKLWLSTSIAQTL